METISARPPPNFLPPKRSSGLTDFDGDGADYADYVEAALLWDRRYDRETLNDRRRDNYVSPGHFIKYKKDR